MTQSMIEHICFEASDIASGVQKLKNRAMVYQVFAKESLAEKRGLPLDTYHNLPFAQWVAVRDQKELHTCANK